MRQKFLSSHCHFVAEGQARKLWIPIVVIFRLTRPRNRTQIYRFSSRRVVKNSMKCYSQHHCIIIFSLLLWKIKIDTLLYRQNQSAVERIKRLLLKRWTRFRFLVGQNKNHINNRYFQLSMATLSIKKQSVKPQPCVIDMRESPILSSGREHAAAAEMLRHWTQLGWRIRKRKVVISTPLTWWPLGTPSPRMRPPIMRIY